MLAGEVVAVELHAGRARELEENARRLGATNVTVVNADGLALPPELTGFDRALVDAPCSGLGVLAGAARPALARAAAPGAPAGLAPRRCRAREAGRDGRLLGCTLNADENEAIVDASGLEVETSGRSCRRSATRSGPSSC